MHVSCYEVIKGPHSIAQTEQEHYWGIPSKVSWGERFSPGKLRHDVGK